MKAFEQKEVCLLLNLGGFEKRMEEHLTLAKNYGKVVYSLTGDGLVKVEHSVYPVPVNVMDLTPAELLIWSSTLNEQLVEEGFSTLDTAIFAAGNKYRGLLPLGTAIGQGIRIGA